MRSEGGSPARRRRSTQVTRSVSGMPGFGYAVLKGKRLTGSRDARARRLRRPTFRRIRKIPQDGSLAIAALVSFIPFCFLTLFFIFNESALKASSGYGVLDLELAWTPGTINRIFAAWGPSEIRYQVFAHRLDFAYLVCYGVFAALCVLLLARRLDGRLQSIGFFFVLAPPLAALFDALENAFLLSMMYRRVGFRPSSPALASTCASFKIAFLGATLSFLFMAVLLLLLKSSKKTDFYFYLVLLVTGTIVIWLLSIWNVYVCIEIGVVYSAIMLLFVWGSRSKRRQGVPAPS